MTTTQTPATLLLSLAAQVTDAKTSTEQSDLYLLARGVFYSNLDALSDSTTGNVFETESYKTLVAAWDEVLDASFAWSETHPSTVVGLVSFSDGSVYGGRS